MPWLPSLLPPTESERTGTMPAPNRSHPDYDWCIGSSELGGCLKAQAAARLGYTPLPVSEKMQGYYDRGHEHEEQCLVSMVREGWGWTRQLEYIIDCDNRVGVIVHPDAVGSTGEPGPNRVIEVKAPSTWESFERAVRTNNFTDPYMHKIAWQVSCQMVATGLEAVIACWDEEHGLRTFGIEVPPFSTDQIQRRVEELVAVVSGGTLPIECSQSDYPCPFVYLHEESDAPDHDPAMDSLVLAYAEAADAEKAAKARKESIRAEVEALLDGEAYHSAVAKVTRYTQERRRLDKNLLIADGLDPEGYMDSVEVNGMRITLARAEAEPTPEELS